MFDNALVFLGHRVMFTKCNKKSSLISFVDNSDQFTIMIFYFFNLSLLCQALKNPLFILRF